MIYPNPNPNLKVKEDASHDLPALSADASLALSRPQAASKALDSAARLSRASNPIGALQALGFRGATAWSWLDVQPPPSPAMRSNFVYELNAKRNRLLGEIWRACAKVRDKAPEPPLADMSQIWTEETKRYWDEVHSSNPDILGRYTRREQAEKKTGALGVLNILLREAHSEHCSPINGCETDIGKTKSNTFLEAVQEVSERRQLDGHRNGVGMFTAGTDLKIAFGKGWQSRSSYLDFSTESSVKSTLQTDVNSTNDSDEGVRELLSAIQRNLPGTVGGLNGLRGLFLYPRHGFREWHSNRHDPPGWRMYLIHAKEDSRSWFAVKDPKTGAVHHLPDYDGKVNLFRIDADEPIWHSIYSMTDRFSCGVHITDEAAAALIRAEQR